MVLLLFPRQPFFFFFFFFFLKKKENPQTKLNSPDEEAMHTNPGDRAMRSRRADAMYILNKGGIKLTVRPTEKEKVVYRVGLQNNNNNNNSKKEEAELPSSRAQRPDRPIRECWWKR